MLQNKLIERQTGIPVLFMVRQVIVEFLRLGILTIAVHSGDGTRHEVLIRIAERFDIRIFLNCVKIRLTDGIRDGEVRDQQKVFGGFVSGEQHTPVRKRHLKRLRNHTAAIHALAVRTFLNAEHCPVNGERFRQNPVQITVFFIDSQYIGRSQHGGISQPSDAQIVRNQPDFILILHLDRQLFGKDSFGFAECLGKLIQ